MDKISELIQKNKGAVEKEYQMSGLSDGLYGDYAEDVAKGFTKDLIDAVIEDEEKEIKKADKFVPFQRIHYVDAKQGTISKLKAIREML